MTICLNIAAIVISLSALIFSIVSFRRSQKIKRIENYLQFGTPQEIDKESRYLAEKKVEALNELNQQCIKRKKAIAEDFGSRGLIHSGVTKQAMQEADEEKKREVKKIEKEFNHKMEMLNLKRQSLMKL